jgi:putative peptide zinc metalloprotease protein
VGPHGVKGDAFVGENDVARIVTGQRAKFVPGIVEMAAVQCRVQAVDKVNVATLDEPSVASVYGGPIAAEAEPKTHQLVPLQAIWRVRFGECDGTQMLSRDVTGTVMLGAGRESFAARGVRALVAAVQREAGF